MFDGECGQQGRRVDRPERPLGDETLTEGVITLEFATMLQLAASDELRLQI